MTRSTPASLSLKGQLSKHTTVKRFISSLSNDEGTSSQNVKFFSRDDSNFQLYNVVSVTQKCQWYSYGMSYNLESKIYFAISSNNLNLKGRHTRGVLVSGYAPTSTNDVVGIIYPREQNFHPEKYSTALILINICYEDSDRAN